MIGISSVSTEHVNPRLGGYAASKRALVTTTQALARELGPEGIRVNQVAPAHIWGASLAAYFERLATEQDTTAAEVYARVAADNALGTIHASAQIAQVVVFFASELSRAVTGQTLHANCGRYFH